MNVDIRLLQLSDAEALREFILRVPEGDRTFFREDVLDPEVVGGWQTHAGERWIAVVEEDRNETVVGYLGVVPDVGWSSHVGELRLVVDGTRRRKGVGRALARRGLQSGIEAGLQKLVVQVSATQESTLAMFASLGFEAEALLKDHVRGASGSLHDLITMSHFIEETYATMRVSGIGDAVSPS